MTVSYKQLNRTHKEYDKETLEQYRDLAVGGAQFLKNVRKYLTQNELEPDKVYDRRIKQAHYIGYCGRIINYFGSFLFSRALTITSDKASGDPWWNAFSNDCDGDGTHFDDFVRRSFDDALIDRCAYWRIEFPRPNRSPDERPLTVAEYEASRLGEAKIEAVPACHIVNWRSEDGQWVWVMEHECEKELINPTDEYLTVTETWTQWNSDGSARRWQCVYEDKPGNHPIDTTLIPEVEPPYNPCGAIPIVGIELQPVMWAMNHLASGQMEHFRKRNANSWAIDRTCYATAVLKRKNRKQPLVLGRGYYLEIDKDDSLEWPSPPSSPFQVVEDYTAKMVEELHRLVDQMWAGISNNAAAIGRSGESKTADQKATAVVMEAYGDVVESAVKATYDLLARGRGELLIHSVSGMSGYDQIDDPEAAVARLTTVSSSAIQSLTLKKVLTLSAAMSFVRDASEETRSTIKQEIEDSFAAQKPPPPVEIFAYDHDNGVILVDEARARKGLEPLPSGEGNKITTLEWRGLINLKIAAEQAKLNNLNNASNNALHEPSSSSLGDGSQ